MYLHKYFSALALLAIPAMMSATGYSVKGSVVESQSAEPEPGARIVIYNPKDSVASAKIGATDVNGSFNIIVDRAGQYKMKVSFPGTKEEQRDLTLSDETPDLQVGVIVLYPDAETLQEVVVTGRRPVIQADGEKVTYNVDEDPAAGSKTVIEMLRKVPMVTVDGQDNIKVNGQSDFKIYVNGRPDPMLGQNASTVLKSMPASSIKKIEVIMEPGAKYDAEGVGGILNIITEGKKSFDGFLSTITAGITNTNANAGVYARTKVDKVTGSINVNYYNSRFNPMGMDGFIERENYNSESQAYSRQEIKGDNRNDFISGSANFSWEPNSNNLFTVSASLMKGLGSQNLNTLSKFYSIDNLLTSSDNQWMRSNWDFGSFNVLGSYQHMFSEDHNLVISYQYSHGTSKSDTYQFNEGILNYENPFPALFNSTENPSDEHTIQADYTLPFAKHYTLESGLKGIFRRNKGIGSYLAGETLDNMLPANNYLFPDVNMRQNQDVGAIYASVSGKWNALSAKAGLRYEHTRTALKYLVGDYDDFSSYLNDVVPNAAIAYNFSMMHSLRLSYQMRIRRPSVNELNPFKENFLSDMIKSGNPNLNSEKSHNISLTYTNFVSFLSINLTAAYRFSNNLISQYSYIDDNTIYFTYENAGRSNQASLSAYLGFRISPKISLNVNATGRYVNYDFSSQEIKRSGWEGNFGGDFNWTMPWNMMFNAYGGFATSAIELQGKRTGWNYYGLSLSKSLLKDNRLKLSLNANNFIDTKMRIHNVNVTPDYKMVMHIAVPAWSVGFSMSYTFGNLNSDVKRTTASIINDDVEVKKGGSSIQ